jgi:hypothetical protein
VLLSPRSGKSVLESHDGLAPRSPMEDQLLSCGEEIGSLARGFWVIVRLRYAVGLVA